jgi:hypothetical protein
MLVIDNILEKRHQSVYLTTYYMKQCNASVLPRSNAAIVLGRDEKMHADMQWIQNYCIQIYVDPLMSQQHLNLVNLHSLLPPTWSIYSEHYGLRSTQKIRRGKSIVKCLILQRRWRCSLESSATRPSSTMRFQAASEARRRGSVDSDINKQKI